MFRIDDWQKIAKICGILSVVIFLFIKWLAGLVGNDDAGFIQSWMRPLLSSAGLAVLLFYFYGKWLWILVWKICPKFNEWVFPNLNGCWKGTVSSNWPIVKKLLPEFANTNETEFSEHSVTVIINQDLFGIHLSLTADDNYTSSETIVVVPEKDKKSGKIVLYELFSSSTKKPLNTDAARHYGAGVLEYLCNDAGEVIEGNYWTERGWNKGLNTAGSIKVFKQ